MHLPRRVSAAAAADGRARRAAQMPGGRVVMSPPSRRLILVTRPEHGATAYASRRGRLHKGRGSAFWNAWVAWKAAEGYPGYPPKENALDALLERGDRLADLIADADDRPERADADTTAPESWHVFTASDPDPPPPVVLRAGAAAPRAPRAPAAA